VIPTKNFGKYGGFGALELSVRYSQIDLNAHELEGGKLNDLTIGANWFLNPVTRISANYIRADVVDLGLANIFEMRFQLVF
jgi:phosphate-selective porin OprO/OprP